MTINIIGTPVEDTQSVPKVIGNELIPIGGVLHVTPEQIRDYILTYFGKEAISLGNVDNTSDENKPLSKDTRVALAKKLNITDQYVKTVNGLTGDVVITPKLLGLGNVNNTSDKDKPLSDSSIYALSKKLDKAIFNDFKKVFIAFQKETLKRLQDLEDYDLYLLNKISNLEEFTRYLQSEIEHLTQYFNDRIDYVSQTLSEEQLDIINDFLLVNIDNYLYNSSYLSSEISRIERLIEDTSDEINLKLEELGVADEELQKNLDQAITYLNELATEFRAKFLDIEILVKTQANELDRKFKQAQEYIDGEIRKLDPILEEIRRSAREGLNDLKDTINGKLDDIDKNFWDIKKDIDDQRENSKTIESVLDSKHQDLLNLLDNTNQDLSTLIENATEQAKKDMEDLGYQMGMLKETITFDRREIEGIIETQVEQSKIETQIRIEDAKKDIENLQKEIKESEKYFNDKFTEISKEMDDKSEEALAAIAQEVIDRNNAINAKVKEATDEINKKLDNLDFEDIDALNKKIDELNEKIENNSAILSQEVIDYVDGKVAAADKKLTERIDNIKDEITLDDIDRLGVISKLDDGLTKETIARKEGEESILLTIENNKVSNENAIANVYDTLEVKVAEGIASSETIKAHDSRLQALDKTTGDLVTSNASIVSKQQTLVTEQEALSRDLTTYKAEFDSKDAEVRGLIIQEAKTRSTEIGNVTSLVESLESSFSNISSAGRNLLLSSNVPLTRSPGAYLIGSYTIGEAMEVGAVYTVIASITHTEALSDIETVTANQGSKSRISLGKTKDSNQTVFKGTFTAIADIKTISFYYIPSSVKTGIAIVHWAVLVKGESIKLTDWVESPFDVNAREVKTNASISKLAETTAEADKALTTQIEVQKSSLEELNKSVTASITKVEETLVTLDSSTSSKLDAVTTEFRDKDTVNKGLIAAESKSRSDADSALSERIDLVQASSALIGRNLLPAIYSDPSDIDLVTAEIGLNVSFKAYDFKVDGALHDYTNGAYVLKASNETKLILGSILPVFKVKDMSHLLVSAYVYNNDVDIVDGLSFSLMFYYNANGTVLSIVNGSWLTIRSTEGLEPNRLSSLIKVPDLATHATLSIKLKKNSNVIVERLLVEKADSKALTPGEWVPGVIGSTANATIVNKVTALTEANLSLTEEVKANTTTIQKNDTEVKGLIAQETSNRSTDISNVLSKVDSMQSSYDNTVVGVGNLWWLNSPIFSSGTGTRTNLTTNLQHQKIVVNSIDATKGYFEFSYKDLKHKTPGILIEEGEPYSVGFEIKSPAKAISLTISIFKASNPIKDVVFNITKINTWTKVVFNNLIPLEDTIVDPNWSGNLLIKIKHSDVAGNLVGQSIEIRNLQLQQGTHLSAYTNTIDWQINDTVSKVDARVTEETLARTSADEAMSGRITAFDTKLSDLNTDLSGKIVTESNTRIADNKVISQRIDTISSEVRNFSIGAVNLIDYSDRFNPATVKMSSSLKLIVDDNGILLTPVNTNLFTDTLTKFPYPDTNLDEVKNTIVNKPDIKLIVSFWIQALTTANTGISVLPRFRLYSTLLEPTFVQGAIDRGNLTRVSYLISPENLEVGFPDTAFNLGLSVTDKSVGKGLRIRKWKIEVGDKPTDWSEYSDISKRIESQLSSSISSVNKTLTDELKTTAESIEKMQSTFNTAPNIGINLLNHNIVDLLDKNQISPNTYNIVSGVNVPYKGLTLVIPKSTAMQHIWFDSNPTAASFTTLTPGRYLLSFWAKSSIKSLRVYCKLSQTNTTTSTSDASIDITDVFKRYSVSLVVSLSGKYSVVLGTNTDLAKTIFIEGMMLEQQTGTSSTPSTFREGQLLTAYSLIPIDASTATIAKATETNAEANKATLKQVGLLETKVDKQGIDLNSKIVTVTESVTTLSQTTVEQINSMESSFRKELVLSSKNLWSIKGTTALRNPSIFTKDLEEYSIIYKNGSTASASITHVIDNTWFKLKERCSLSFNIKVLEGDLKNITVSRNGFITKFIYIDGEEVPIQSLNSHKFSTPLTVNTEVRCTFIFEKTSTTTSLLDIQPNSSFTSTAGLLKAEISQIQLTLGSQVSAWTVALPDQQEQLATTNAKINTAESTAASANKATADSLKTLTTEVKNQNTANAATISRLDKATADLKSSTATSFQSVDAKFEQLPNTGSNLLPMELTNPQYRPSNYSSGHEYAVEKSTDTPNLNRWKLTASGTAEQGIYFNEGGGNTNFILTLPKGTYIFSFYAKFAGTAPQSFKVTTYNSTMNSSFMTGSFTTGLKRYSGGFTLSKETSFCILMYANTTGSTTGNRVYIQQMMLEKQFASNPEPSPWTMGTSDLTNVINSNVSSLTTAFTEADKALGGRIDTINVSISNNSKEVDAKIKTVSDTVVELDKAVSTRFDNVSSSISNLKASGYNLLKASNVPLVRNGSAYKIGQYDLGENLYPGEIYTIVTCITHNDTVTTGSVGAWQTSMTRIIFQEPTVNKTKAIYKATFKAQNLVTNSIQFYLYPESVKTGTATVHWAVVTRGENLSQSDWSQSPYDIEEGYNNINKTIDASIKTVNQTIANTKEAIATDMKKIESKFDGIVVGGDNFISNPGFWDAKPTSATGITTTVNKDLSLLTCVVKTPNGNWVTNFLNNSRFLPVINDIVNVGEDFVVSVDVKYEGTSKNTPEIKLYFNNGYFPFRLVPSQTFKPGVWLRYYQVISKNTNLNMEPHFGFESANAGTYIFRNMKIEKGNLPTPFLVGVQTEFNKTNSSISEFKETYASDTAANSTKMDVLRSDLESISGNNLLSLSYFELGNIENGIDKANNLYWRISSGSLIRVKPNTKYVYSSNETVASNIAYFDEKGLLIQADWVPNNRLKHLLTTPANAYTIRFASRLSTSKAYTPDQLNFQLEESSIATRYTRSLLDVVTPSTNLISKETQNQVLTVKITNSGSQSTNTLGRLVVNRSDLNLYAGGPLRIVFTVTSNVDLNPDTCITIWWSGRSHASMLEGLSLTNLLLKDKINKFDLKGVCSLATEGLTGNSGPSFTIRNAPIDAVLTISGLEMYSSLSTKAYTPTPGDVLAAEANESLKTDVSNIDQTLKSESQKVLNLQNSYAETVTYKLYSSGYDFGAQAGVYDPKTGVALHKPGRGILITVYNNSGGFESNTQFDTFTTAGETAASNFIKGIAVNKYVSITSYDSFLNNGLSNVLKDALISLGASSYTIDQVKGRCAYILVGRKGLKEDGAVELLNEAPGQTLEYLLQFKNGVPVALGGKGSISNAFKSTISRIEKTESNIKSVAEEQTLLKTDVSDMKGGQFTSSALTKMYGSSEFGKASSGKFDEFIANVTIGGSNLLLNSRFNENFDSWSKNNVGKFEISVSGELATILPINKSLRIYEAPGGNAGVYQYITLPSGTDVVFSVWLWGRGTVVKILGEGHSQSRTITLTPKWTRYVIKSRTTVANPPVTIYTANASASNDFWVSSAQYEVGTKETDWAPNAEDANIVIAQTAKATSDLKVVVDNNQSKINKIDILESTTTLSSSKLNDLTLLMSAAVSENLVENFGDPIFLDGNNNVKVYDNSNSGNVTITRVAKAAGNPTKSTHQLNLRSIGGATPDFGGFVTEFVGSSSSVYLIKYIIKFPKGFTLKPQSNSTGIGGTHPFIGDTDGTGAFQIYYRVIKYGASGAIASTGHVSFGISPTNPAGSFTPTASKPLNVEIASIEVYDATSYSGMSPVTKKNIASITTAQEVISDELQSKTFQHQQLKSSFNLTGIGTQLPSGINFKEPNKFLYMQYPLGDKSLLYASLVPLTPTLFSYKGENATAVMPVSRAISRVMVYVEKAKVYTFDFSQDEDAGIVLNNVDFHVSKGYGVKPGLKMNLPAGWSIIDVIIVNASGNGGFSFTPPLSTAVDRMYAADASDILPNNLATITSNFYTKADIDGSVTERIITDSSKYAKDLVTIPDVRYTNEPPSYYWSKYPRRTVTEFKQGSNIGSPGGIGGYGNLTSNVQWSDSSGGPIQQVFSSGDGAINTWYRYSTNNTTWSAWKNEGKNIRDDLANKADTATIRNEFLTKADADGVVAKNVETLSANIGSNNIIFNGDFTSGLDNWVKNTQGVYNFSVFTNSNKRSYAKMSGAVSADLFRGIATALTPDKNGLKGYTEYTLSFTAESLIADSTELFLILHRNNSSGTNQLGAGFKLEVNKLNQYKYTFKTVASITSLNIVLYVNPNIAFNIHITDVQLQEGPYATYFTKSARELSSAVEVTKEAISGPNGIESKFGVKVDAGGLISGFGILATANNGKPSSAFAVNASQFYVGDPKSNKKPFIVLTSAGTINGTSVPAGTYMDTAFIGNATIVDAQIKNLHADKITAGIIDAARIRVGSKTTYEAGYDPTKIIAGTENLLDGSNDPNTNTNYPFAWCYFNSPPKAGEIYTFTVWCDLEPNTKLVVYNSGGLTSITELVLIAPGVYRGSAPWKLAAEGNTHLNIYAIGHVAGGATTFYRAKMELGSLGSEWSPSSFDRAAETSGAILGINRTEARKNTWLCTTIEKSEPLISMNVIPDYRYLVESSYIIKDQKYLSDGNTMVGFDHSIMYYRCVLHTQKAGSINIGKFTGDDAHAIYVNLRQVYSSRNYSTSTSDVILPLRQSWNIIDVIVNNSTGGAGFRSTINISAIPGLVMYAVDSPNLAALAAQVKADTAQNAATTAAQAAAKADSKATQAENKATSVSNTVSSWTTAGTTTIDGSKITAGSIITKNLAVGDFTNLFGNRYFDPRGSQIGTNTGWVIKELHGRGGILAGRDHIGWDNPFELSPGDTFVIEFTAGRQRGNLSINAGVWLRVAENAGNVTPYPHLYTTQVFTLSSLGAGWYRYQATVKVTDTTAAYGLPYFQIEQPEKGGSTQWTVGDVLIRRALAGNMIIDGTLEAKHLSVGSVTADKLTANTIDTIAIKARNATFIGSDGSKQVINGGITRMYYPNGRLAMEFGVI